MAVSRAQLLDLLTASFPDAVLDLREMAQDNDHYQLIITSQAFSGQTKIKQHQMVYKALGDLMNDKLHAISITTRLPN